MQIMHDKGQDPRDQLRAFMEAKDLSQVELAREAKISQSTVSRALVESPKRSSKAKERLFRYANIQLKPMHEITVGGKGRVIKAFDKIWDGSEAHAAAVVRIIEALEGMRPSGEEKEDA